MTEAEVLAIYTGSFYGALKSRDFGALEKLYSSKYMLVRIDGSVLTKQQVLQDLRDDGLTFSSIELHREQVWFFGSLAVLTVESHCLIPKWSGESPALPVRRRLPAGRYGSSAGSLPKHRDG